jgi:hypothetical protein
MLAASPLVAALLLAHAPVVAAGDQSPPFPDPQMQEQLRRAEDLARKGIDDLIRSFEAFKEGLPVYGAPYVDRHGNIVVPRRPPTPPSGTPVPERPPERT